MGKKIEITLFLTVPEIISVFHLLHKNPRWPPKVAKIENFPVSIGYSCTTLWFKNLLKIALSLSLTVFEIFTLFHFVLKFKMATKSGKNEIFPLGTGFSSVGQKYARNGSISYHFQDIFSVLFSAKIQDCCQKWQKLKFPPFP